jgi:hypothetical protein
MSNKIQVNRVARGNVSSALLKAVLDVIPGNQCKSNYSSAAKSQLASGILDESQMCAGDVKGEKDTSLVSYMCFVFTYNIQKSYDCLLDTARFMYSMLY